MTKKVSNQGWEINPRSEQRVLKQENIPKIITKCIFSPFGAVLMSFEDSADIPELYQRKVLQKSNLS